MDGSLNQTKLLHELLSFLGQQVCVENVNI